MGLGCRMRRPTQSRFSQKKACSGNEEAHSRQKSGPILPRTTLKDLGFGRFRYGAGKNAFERLATFLLRHRIGQRLARQHLIALRSVVDKDRFNCGDLFQVFGLQPLKYVLVGMVRAALVVEFVLDELKSGNSDSVKAEVIGPARVAHGQGGHAEILERRDPLRKNGRNGGVALQIDATNLARSVVDIEVAGDEFLLWFHFERSCIASHEFWKRNLVGRGGERSRAKVFLRVTLRTKEPLFFTGP